MAPRRGTFTTVVNAEKYLLGLDAGNTVIKAVLFDLTGRQIAMHTLDGQSSTPQPGHVERDLNELWSNAQTAIRGCIDAAGIDPAQIAAIGCAGHGNGLYLLDKSDAPLIGIQSLDSRAATLAKQIDAANGSAIYDICRQRPWPSQTPVLLAWIKQHRPEIFARTGTAMLCKDFMGFKLTGEKFSDISDMSGCGLTVLPACRYSDKLMALYGLADATPMLPRLCDPAEIAGHVTDEAAAITGLTAGTPVIAGYFDVVSSALGSGVSANGEASIIVGSWSINQVFSDTPVNDERVFMAAGFGKNRFLNIESSATSAANLEWYVREFVERGQHHDDPFGYCNDQIAAVQPAKDDPFFHPFLYGARQGAEFRAGFYGLAGWHTEGHMLRAIFEGVMFEHRRHIDVLSTAGVVIERAALSGGGSRSPHWPQMFSDGLGMPITVAEARETGALGAVIGAGIGVGIFADYEAGVAAMTRPRQTFSPDPAKKAFYDARYAAWLDLTARMRGFWSSLK